MRLGSQRQQVQVPIHPSVLILSRGQKRQTSTWELQKWALVWSFKPTLKQHIWVQVNTTIAVIKLARIASHLLLVRSVKSGSLRRLWVQVLMILITLIIKSEAKSLASEWTPRLDVNRHLALIRTRTSVLDIIRRVNNSVKTPSHLQLERSVKQG